MILLLILKGLGLVEYALDYLINVNVQFAKGGAADGYQWQLSSVYIVPTAKGWAILDDVWTLVHNVMDMLAQFSTFFPANADTLNVSNMGINFPHP
jgi:hypothetical protein